MSVFARLVGSEPPQAGGGRSSPARARNDGQDFSGFLEKADAAGSAPADPAMQTSSQSGFAKTSPRTVGTARGDASAADPIAELAQTAVGGSTPIPTARVAPPSAPKPGEQAGQSEPTKASDAARAETGTAACTDAGDPAPDGSDKTADSVDPPASPDIKQMPASPDGAALPYLTVSATRALPPAPTASLSVQPAVPAASQKSGKATASPADANTVSDPSRATTQSGSTVDPTGVNPLQQTQATVSTATAPASSQPTPPAVSASSGSAPLTRVGPPGQGVQPQPQAPNSGTGGQPQQTAAGPIEGTRQPTASGDTSDTAGVTGPAAPGAISPAQDSPMPAPGSPTQQVMAALTQLGLAVTDVEPSTATARPATTAAASAPSGDHAKPATVRGMTIQLNPEHLGPVSVTLRMKAGVVDIHIAVANPETLQLLDEDRHVLSALVEAAGRRDHTIDLGPAPQQPHKADASALATPFDNSGAERRDAPSMNSSGRRSAPSGHVPPSLSSTSAIDDSPIASPSRHLGLDGSLYL